MHLPGNIINLEALLYALAQQSTPLPESLQRSFAKIVQSWQVEPTEEDARELRRIIKSYEPLETFYQEGLVESDRRYISQERTKGISTNFPSVTELENFDFRAFITSSDWVNAAKQAMYRQRSKPKRSNFLLRGDRVVTLASGGAFLGVLIFQIPGAIIGGLLAGIYAWFSFPTAKADGNN